MKFILKLMMDTPAGPYIMIPLIILGAIATVFVLIREHKDGEALREADKAHGDSIWDDK